MPTPHVALQKRISERVHKQIVAVPVPHVTLQEGISERLHEQTVDQPGDQPCRDPEDFLHRQGCRYACGDATTVPRIQTVLMTVRWQSNGGADGMRQVACPRMRPHHVRRGRRVS